MTEIAFSDRLLAWFATNRRRHLPWQQERTLYRVWISEIMLQQTQVSTVIDYFQRFIQRFPDVQTLASAAPDEVLHLWSGLGYYARARNIHRAARIVLTEQGGHLPLAVDQWQRLPGIGRSTAGAILALATGQRHPILDGNVKRVLCRFHGIAGWPGRREVAQTLWQLAEAHTPHEQVAEYTQAIMDLGATVCTRHRALCAGCPLQAACRAHAQGRVRDYPTSRPRRDLPVRHTMFVLARRPDGSVLLERRSPTGVWGGLWSFPECAPDTDLEDWCWHRLGQWPLAIKRLPGRRHRFSHVHWHISPVLLEISEPVSMVMELDSTLWYNSMAPEKIYGLPAPVAEVLQR